MADSTNLDSQHIETLSTLSRAKGFLGREFLTWLWFVSETEAGELQWEDDQGAKHGLDIWLDDRLALESPAGTSHENVIKGGDPARSSEAATALLSGKTLKQAKIGMRVDGIGEFSANLQDDDLSPRSLKLPDPSKPESIVDPEAAPVVYRITQTGVFISVLDQLFQRFLAERTGKDWTDDGLVRIRTWIRDRHDKLSGRALH